MSDAEGILRAMTWREAIASVALTHQPTCTCDVCKASAGDDEALTRVMAAIERLEGMAES